MQANLQGTDHGQLFGYLIYHTPPYTQQPIELVWGIVKVRITRDPPRELLLYIGARTPRVIVSGRDLARVIALTEVFPAFPTLVCRWHT